MVSEEFDYEEVRQSPNFQVKKYKDSIYRGEVNTKTLKREGRGIMQYDTGRFYEGLWKNDKRHGHGFEVF